TRLVKIDVEGYEPEVLRGARDLLGRRSAIWLTEASIQNPEPSAQTIRTLMEAGYAVHWLFAPFATPASAKARPATPGRGDANVVALPPGVPNRWNLPLISDPSERRPSGADAYPYLAR